MHIVEFHVNGVRDCIALFCVWLRECSLRLLGFIYVVCVSGSFLFIAVFVSLFYQHRIYLFIHPVVDGYLCYFQLLVAMNKVAVSVLVHVFVWTHVFISLG